MTKEIKDVFPVGDRILIESTMYKKQSSIILTEKPTEATRESYEKVEDRILKVGSKCKEDFTENMQIILSPYAQPSYFQTIEDSKEKIIVQAVFDTDMIVGIIK